MKIITKERLLKIQQWRETYGPGSNVVLPAEEAEELAEIALAAMQQEPVAYIFKHPAGKLFWAITDESNKGQSDVIPVYADPHIVPVIMGGVSGALEHAYKELTPTFMRNHIDAFERYGIAPSDSSTVIQAIRIALDGIERRASMLQGKAEHVSNRDELNYPVIMDGWVMVPFEPTAEMLNAAWVSHGIYHPSAYRTMIAAAPQQQVK